MSNIVKMKLKLNGMKMEHLMHQQTALIDILKDKKDKTAIIWVGDDPKDTQKISYKQLHSRSF